MSGKTVMIDRERVQRLQGPGGITGPCSSSAHPATTNNTETRRSSRLLLEVA
jgi:hypothetical protein